MPQGFAFTAGMLGGAAIGWVTDPLVHKTFHRQGQIDLFEQRARPAIDGRDYNVRLRSPCPVFTPAMRPPRRMNPETFSDSRISTPSARALAASAGRYSDVSLYPPMGSYSPIMPSGSRSDGHRAATSRSFRIS